MGSDIFIDNLPIHLEELFLQGNIKFKLSNLPEYLKIINVYCYDNTLKSIDRKRIGCVYFLEKICINGNTYNNVNDIIQTLI